MLRAQRVRRMVDVRMLGRLVIFAEPTYDTHFGIA